MATLKDLRARIGSVKSTQKITSAMKMVAAAKLRRAEDQARASRPYAQRMERMLASLATAVADRAGAPKLLAGTGKDEVHLLVVATADRGLCGSFNSNIVRQARLTAQRLQDEGKTVKILCVGRKARDMLRRQFRDSIVDTLENVGRPRPSFESASSISDRILEMFEAGEFDVCTVFYAEYKSAMTQFVRAQQLIPFRRARSEDEKEEEQEQEASEEGVREAESGLGGAVYEYEPDETEILSALLPRNLAVQMYKVLLENAASEHGSRMTAMDNATRNAGDMIRSLTQQYNRTRQAAITRELIEIISAKEAM